MRKVRTETLKAPEVNPPVPTTHNPTLLCSPPAGLDSSECRTRGHIRSTRQRGESPLLSLAWLGTCLSGLCRSHSFISVLH